jgi:pilus assembly protein Flp/PilA
MLIRLLIALWYDEDGATAIEYGLIAALISIACIMAFLSLGLNLTNIFTTISDTLAGAIH